MEKHVFVKTKNVYKWVCHYEPEFKHTDYPVKKILEK